MNKLLLFTMAFLAFIFSGCATTEPPCRTILDNRAPVTGMSINAVNIVDQSIHTKKIWATYCNGHKMSTHTEGPNKDNPADYYERFKITVEKHGSERTPTGTLLVYTILRNQTDFPLQVEARTWFMDDKEIPSEKSTAWQRLQLPPKTIGTYKESSTETQNAHYYFVEVREGR
jgi:hypothetical protein